MVTGRDRAPNIAVFCDYENVAIGVQQAKYDNFEIELVLERLLARGNIIVKKAYADWERYKGARRGLHEAAFELIEIPHVSYSGKNSADIRLVVDALDLCYTKGHLDIFAIVSGDSDFSPLVAKLRENDKTVIGLGVKNSSSDLLIDNCDEFIFYDDLERARVAQVAKAKGRAANKPSNTGAVAKKVAAPPTTVEVAKTRLPSSEDRAPRHPPEETNTSKPSTHTKPTNAEDEEQRKLSALSMVLDVVDALFRDRNDNFGGSLVKQALKRKKPQFSESFHGYRSFTQLLEDAQRRGLLELVRDEKSGGYLVVGFGPKA